MHKSLTSIFFGLALLTALPAAPVHAQFYGNYPAYYGQAGGFLMGASSVINSNGQFMMDTERARFLNQKYKQEKINTQRQAFDEWRYEKALTPTLEETRQKSVEQELLRSRNDPPLTEIWAGKALNDLLNNLQKLQGGAGYVSSSPLDQNTLKHINVTNGTTESGNSSILRDGKTRWPLVLKTKDFASDRKKIDALVVSAARQARGGDVDGDTLTDLIGSIKSMDRKLRSKVADVPSTDYIRGKRYITELEGVTKVLQDPNVANYFDKWTAKGKDVAELVANMTRSGLKFAPAITGDEAAYTSLHRAMANYQVALSSQLGGPQMTASKPTTPFAPKQ